MTDRKKDETPRADEADRKKDERKANERAQEEAAHERERDGGYQ